MSTPSRDELLERLRQHRLVGSCPPHELEWIADHSVFYRWTTDQAPFRKGDVRREFFIVLTGRFAIHIEERHGWRRVMEWTGGDISGLVPYSRMSGSPGDTVVEEDVDVIGVSEDFFPEMIRECPCVTTAGVHVMLDRARHFNSAMLQDEKMLSLGRVAAGLAHELNNPASAAVRSAQLLTSQLIDADAAARALGAVALTPEQRQTLEHVRDVCILTPAPASRSPLERSDREDEIAGWLTTHGADERLAEPLSDTPVTLELLDELAQTLGHDQLNLALQWIASGCSARALARDIERATSRIHQLVSSIKRFSYMDRASVAEPVDVPQLLNDTVLVLASKARSKSISLRLEVEPNLPKVLGFGGELNQVWMNLIDNAIDAAPEGGQVTVSARREPGFVAVRVTDNGPGIPEDVRPKIFDPFYTTKPPGQGTGMGLDLVQRVVRGHRAEIDVTTRPGHTEFRVALPTGEAVAAPATA
jgi:signal transduction histidine kinase